MVWLIPNTFFWFAANTARCSPTTLEKYGFGCYKHGWKYSKVSIKTPSFVTANTAGDGPTTPVNIWIRSPQTRMEKSRGVPSIRLVLSPKTQLQMARPDLEKYLVVVAANRPGNIQRSPSTHLLLSSPQGRKCPHTFRLSSGVMLANAATQTQTASSPALLTIRSHWLRNHSTDLSWAIKV